jgi:hypothetical protein
VVKQTADPEHSGVNTVRIPLPPEDHLSARTGQNYPLRAGGDQAVPELYLLLASVPTSCVDAGLLVVGAEHRPRRSGTDVASALPARRRSAPDGESGRWSLETKMDGFFDRTPALIV